MSCNENELKILENKLPEMLRRSDFESSLKNCIENAFYLHESIDTKKIDNTKTSTHCYFLLPNRECTDCGYEDLANLMLDHLVDYVIPRSKIQEAENSGRTADICKLQRQAKKKFVDYYKQKKQLVESGKIDPKKFKSGEAGEVLLFLIAEQILRLPQAICKMSLKTSNNMHVHGSDGIHIGLTEDKSKLALYYGEVKIYHNISDAIKSCVESIAPIILKREDEEDLTLLYLYCDFGKNDDELLLKEKLKNYFDPEHRNYKLLTEVRGICLVGFDEQNLYNLNDIHDTAKKATEASEQWMQIFLQHAIANEIENVIIDVFFIPMTSVNAFRTSFASVIGGV